MDSDQGIGEGGIGKSMTRSVWLQSLGRMTWEKMVGINLREGEIGGIRYWEKGKWSCWP